MRFYVHLRCDRRATKDCHELKEESYLYTEGGTVDDFYKKLKWTKVKKLDWVCPACRKEGE